MTLRKIRESDLERIKFLHDNLGVDCPFPQMADILPMFAIVDETDQVVMTVGCVPTAEVYFWVDKDWETPGMKQEAFKYLHEAIRIDLKSKGIIQVHAFIPPGIAKHFGRRLIKRFGWARSFWPCFSRRTD
jgi:hypothetical protein